jgi:hypothetical protein
MSYDVVGCGDFPSYILNKFTRTYIHIYILIILIKNDLKKRTVKTCRPSGAHRAELTPLLPSERLQAHLGSLTRKI